MEITTNHSGLCWRCKAVRRKNHGPDHPDTLKTEDHLVNTLCKLGAPLTNREKSLKAEHPHTIVTTHILADIRMAMTNYYEAHEL